jgi:hypothetical protein
MLLVLRPTERGTGLIPTRELELVLRKLGFDYLVVPESIQAIKQLIDRDGNFQEDDLVAYLVKDHAVKYAAA